MSGGDPEGAESMHPCEYEEYSALSYGYPLAPLRRSLRSSDTVVIDTVRACQELTVSVYQIGPDPIGLRSVALNPQTAVNARLVMVTPAASGDVLGYTGDMTVKIVPIDPLIEASAMLRIGDRSGREWYVPYSSVQTHLDQSVGAISYTAIPSGAYRDTTILLTSPMERNVDIRSITLASGARGFRIVSIDPQLPAVLKKGEAIRVKLQFTAPDGDKTFRDTLRVPLDCQAVVIPLSGVTGTSIIQVNDLDFGTFNLSYDHARTLTAQITNTGTAPISFRDTVTSPGQSVTWIGKGFSVPAAEIEALRSMELMPGQSTTFNVTFDPDATGVGSLQTTARVWANTRNSKDLSVWKAKVVSIPVGVASDAPLGDRIEPAMPNPFSGTTAIDFTLARKGQVEIAVYDAFGKRVATLADGVESAGPHSVRWDAEAMPAGVYYCRIGTADWSGSIVLTHVR